MSNAMNYALCAVVAAQKLTAPQIELQHGFSGFYLDEWWRGGMEAMALACRDELEVQRRNDEQMAKAYRRATAVSLEREIRRMKEREREANQAANEGTI